MRIRFELLLSFACAVALCAPANSATLRVKADTPGPAHDGLTWATAYLYVGDAVYAAASGDEVWVAAGTFVENVKIPAATPVSLYGGFAGTETTRGQRTLGPSATILDGGGVATVVAVRASGVTVDNFTIKNGGGTAIFSYNPDFVELQGSGIACIGDNLTVSNCVITGNQPDGGGALGTGPAGNGGGIFCSGANAHIKGNTVSANHVSGSNAINYSLPGYYVSAAGAGMYLSGGGAVVEGNTIVDNTMSFTSAMPPPDTGSRFSDGFTANGAGIYCTQATIRNNIIARNSVTAVSWSRTTLGAVLPTGSASGGGIFATGACVISGNLIYDNSTSGNDMTTGDVYCAAAPALTNNTILDSTSIAAGGTLTNNILGTTPDPMFVNPGAGDYHLKPGSPFIDAGDDSVVTAGDKDLDGNPRIRGAHVDMGCYEAPTTLRVKWNAPGPAHDGLTWPTAYLKVADALTASSPGDDIWVAAGTYLEAVTLNPYRSLLGGFVGTETSANQRNPAVNVTIIDATGKQAAVVAVLTKDSETATVDGFTLQGGYGYSVTFYGGCSEPLCRGGIYDAYHNGGGVYIAGGAPIISNNRIINNDTTYTLQFGYMYDFITIHAGSGGGIYVAAGNAVIIHNTVSGNKSSGGVIEVADGSPTISYNTISANTAISYSVALNIGGASASVSFNSILANSGGVNVSGTATTVTDNTIVNNMGPGVSQNGGRQTLLRNEIRGNAGGGIRLLGGELTATENLIKGNHGQYGGGVNQSSGTLLNLRRNTIVSNTSQRSGGGVWCIGNATIADNLIASNVAGEQGGGIAIDRWYAGTSTAAVQVLNNTFVGNTASTGGGACAVLVGKTVPQIGAVLANNIIASNGSGVYIADGITPTFSHNAFYQNTAYDFQGTLNPIGTNGNVIRPPQFLSSSDYHLFEGSSCIDTGDDSYVQPGDTDLDGKPRLQGGHVDPGCYEFATPTTIDLKAVTDTLKVVAGIYGAIPDTMLRLNPDGNGVIDMRDVVLLARKMTGLD